MVRRSEAPTGVVMSVKLSDKVAALVERYRSELEIVRGRAHPVPLSDALRRLIEAGLDAEAVR